MRQPLNRRTIIRGLGGIAIGLPFLEAMMPRRQAFAAAAQAKRFIAMFTSCGTIADSFFPKEAGATFALPTILAPLAPFQNKLLVLDGVDNEVAYHGPGERHMMGMGSWLTATELQAGTLFADSSTKVPAGWGGGVSVDQYMAPKVSAGLAFKSLEFGVIPELDPPTATVWDRMIYSGPGAPVPPMEDPVSAFNRIFGLQNSTPASDAGTVSPATLLRKTILDLAADDIGYLKKKLGTADRQKLDAHLTAIRDIETRLEPMRAPVKCDAVQAPAKVSYLSNDNYPAIAAAMRELLAMSFACDVTRVSSMQYSYSRGYIYPHWLGISKGHHGLSHEAVSVTSSRDALIKLNTWYAGELAALMKRLSEIPDGAGSVLDNTLILWGNELGEGETHSARRVPFVLAGGAGGYFNMGRSLKYGGVSSKATHSSLLVSCLNAMGIADTTFGNPAYCFGALSQLV